MIHSRDDYAAYLDADRRAMGRRDSRCCLFVLDPLWAFLRLLRKVEYYRNCSTGAVARYYLLCLRFKLKLYQLILGFTIPPNTVGPGLKLPHYGTIVIHDNARIGANARINVGVVIGENNGSDNVPVIGNDVVIEAGAKIFGKIQIADGVHIGANSVVNKSFTEPDAVIVGVPATIVKIRDHARQ
ncbi:serine acetyltransferase [Geobacter sp. FeAm09]|uniref:serine O-acetyltransferase n=1 Tax=Geobacter sp. FeAm09 TaxID=2597769 RepID=UPI0011EBD8A7|nr:serine acetyltransferase [Geobacter sp. FeAm09]QEM68665.1 serine acetyltransferase [Geobacter sp. FeAm09]